MNQTLLQSKEYSKHRNSSSPSSSFPSCIKTLIWGLAQRHSDWVLTLSFRSLRFACSDRSHWSMKLGRKTINGSVKVRNQKYYFKVECCDKYVAKCKITSQKNLCLFSVTICGMKNVLWLENLTWTILSLKTSQTFSE